MPALNPGEIWNRRILEAAEGGRSSLTMTPNKGPVMARNLKRAETARKALRKRRKLRRQAAKAGQSYEEHLNRRHRKRTIAHIDNTMVKTAARPLLRTNGFGVRVRVLRKAHWRDNEPTRYFCQVQDEGFWRYMGDTRLTPDFMDTIPLPGEILEVPWFRLVETERSPYFSEMSFKDNLIERESKIRQRLSGHKEPLMRDEWVKRNLLIQQAKAWWLSTEHLDLRVDGRQDGDIRIYRGTPRVGDLVKFQSYENGVKKMTPTVVTADLDPLGWTEILDPEHGPRRLDATHLVVIQRKPSLGE